MSVSGANGLTVAATAVTSAPRPSPEPVDPLAVVPLPAVGRQVAPAVRPAAVGVGDAVGVGQLAGADDRARPAAGVGRLGERGDAPADVGRRLGDREAGCLDAGVAPGV